MTQRPEPAKLQRIRASKDGGKDAKLVLTPVGDPIDVQFNPTSLQFNYTNNIDLGGVTTNDQRRQNPSAQSATLKFDLEFDTAEERDGEGPIDVRSRTAIVRRFAEPSAEEPKEAPPLLKFGWGAFSFIGIVNQLSEFIDFFSPEGRPLRAKVSLTMKEVRPDIDANIVGPGARTSTNATPPGEPDRSNGDPGSPPVRNPDKVAQAQLGESVQQLLARQNADPATWRAAMADLESPLALPAGTQVQLAGGQSAGPGLGATGGFVADSAVASTESLAGALGVSEGPGATEDVSGPVTASSAVAAGGSTAAPGFISAASGEGFALAEGGGVAASARKVVATQVQASISTARGAFEVPIVPASMQAKCRPAGVDQRTTQSSERRMPPPLDPRTQTFGRGIPLQARPVNCWEP